MDELLRVLLGWQGAAKNVSDGLNTPEDIQRGKESHAAKVAAQRAAAKRRAEEAKPLSPLPGAGVRVQNRDGTFSSERTVGVNIDGREYVIPTLIGGRQFSEKQAIEHARKTGLDKYPSFRSAKEASRYAESRSKRLGQQQQPQKPQKPKKSWYQVGLYDLFGKEK